jgi:probable HAF family extracellular repeat protein
MARGINSSGQVVGFSYNTFGGDGHAFLWDPTNGMQDLGTLPGGTHSGALGINSSGQVVGSSDLAGSSFSHAFLWEGTNGMKDLGTLPGDVSSIAQGINDSGQVVGQSDDVRGHPRAFLWDAVNGMQDLGTLGRHALATGINRTGQVVGESERHDDIDNAYFYHAFVWQNGTMSDLNDLIPPVSGLELFAASAINNAGQIVGQDGHYGEYHAYLLTPDSAALTGPAGPVHFTSSDPQAAVPAAPLFVDASADPRSSFAGPSTVSNVAVRDTPSMQDQRNARSVDAIIASGKQASWGDPVFAGLGSKDAVVSRPRPTLGGGSLDDPLAGSLWSL